MSKTVTTYSAASISGDGTSETFIDSPALVNSSGIAPTGQVLASGANTIAVPAGALGVTIVPPSGNAIGLTVKGISGDTGLQLHLTQSFRWSFPSSGAPATFVITAASAMTAPVQFIWG